MSKTEAAAAQSPSWEPRPALPVGALYALCANPANPRTPLNGPARDTPRGLTRPATWSDPSRCDDRVRHETGKQAYQEAVGKEIGPPGPGRDTDELDDDVDQGTRSKRQEGHADRLGGESVSEDGADRRWRTPDRAQHQKEP